MQTSTFPVFPKNQLHSKRIEGFIGFTVRVLFSVSEQQKMNYTTKNIGLIQDGF